MSNSPYCGCCGRQYRGTSPFWCPLCEPHVGVVGPLENRTHFARTGEDCPYVKRIPVRIAIKARRNAVAVLRAQAETGEGDLFVGVPAKDTKAFAAEVLQIAADLETETGRA